MVLKIGDIKLKNNLFLAPMVDVTDCAYRLNCRQEGAGMAYTEMIYVDAILHENERTQRLLKTGGKNDRPLGLQVTGNNLSNKILVRADKKLDYGRVMEVVKTVSMTGFNQVVLVTELAQ